MSLTRLCTAAGILAVLAIPARAQDWKGGVERLEGHVLDASGQPIEGASVKLELPGRGGTTLKTDKKGKFAILGLTGGLWNLDVTAPGFVAKPLQVPVPLPPGPRVVEIKLEKAQVAGPSPEVMAALQRADADFDAGRFSEALVEYEKALADPKIAAQPSAAKTLHFRIARCLSHEQQYAKEMEHLQAVADADPTDTMVLSLMAQEAMKAGMNDRAIEILAKVDDGSIKDPNIYFNVGVMFLNQQKQDEAVKYFTKAVAVDPTFVDGYFQRGLVYIGQQKNAEAKADFQKVVELQPSGQQTEIAKKALDQIK
jgi:Tfp pilus assembly protein PilF